MLVVLSSHLSFYLILNFKLVLLQYENKQQVGETVDEGPIVGEALLEEYANKKR